MNCNIDNKNVINNANFQKKKKVSQPVQSDVTTKEPSNKK